MRPEHQGKVIKTRGRIAILDNRPIKPFFSVCKAIKTPPNWAEWCRNKHLFVRLHASHDLESAEEFYNSLAPSYFRKD